MILKCDCTNDGQDKLHGKNMRVCNAHKSKSGRIEYRCTVCKKEHSVSDSK